MKKILALSLTCLLSAPVLAETSIIVGGFSKHLGKTTYKKDKKVHSLNEVNGTLGIEHNDWSLAVMNNSYEEWGVMVAHNFNYQYTDNLYFGAKVGAVTGYRDTPVDMRIAPVLQFETGYTIKRVTTVIGYTPPLTDSSKGVFTIHWKVKI